MDNQESMQFDVVIVGAGPAGLSAAIKLKQLNLDCNICIVEKAADIGGHSLSGAVLDPIALNELIPDWKIRGTPPLNTPAKRDKFQLLTEKKAIPLPLPPQMKNEGNYIISLGVFCKWLAEQATQIGVEIFSGFPAQDILYNENDEVCGILTGAFGINKNGNKKQGYQPGIPIYGTHTLFAEGCRGSLSQKLMSKYNLRADCDIQTYGIGIKELWQINPEKHKEGTIIHTIGWPLPSEIYGGSFIYHMGNEQLAIGYVVGLDYTNPYLNPYQEFQRFKSHPKIRPILEGGKRLAYGARALNEGGYQSIPTLSFPGGAMIGCAPGLLNVPKIKGIHTAMKSGMLAAESIIESSSLLPYPEKLRHSWIHNELYAARNIRPGFKFGLWGGLANAVLETVFNGKTPWTLHHKPDHKQLQPAAECPPINYPAPDGVVTFDIASSVYLSNTNHEEDQPCHLKLKDPNAAIEVNVKLYDSPECRYCPAGVYEIIHNKNNQPELHINAQNCVHCKTCDIKDPIQNIIWEPPEGGGGPNYTNM